MADEKIPQIGTEVVEKTARELNRAREAEMEVLAELPVVIKIGGGLEASLYPPTIGKMRLITRIIVGVLGQAGSIGQLMKDMAEQPPSAWTEKILDTVESSFDSLVQITQILLEPNGKPFDAKNPQVPADFLENNLTSAEFQKVLMEALKMLDVGGLKKTLNLLKSP